VETRLETLGAQGRSLVSERAKALIQLAAQGLECLSVPDCFHLVHDIVQSSSLARGRLKQAHQEWPNAEEGFQQSLAVDLRGAADRVATPQVEAKQAEITRWAAMQPAYRQRLATLSLMRHPCGINDAAPQASTQVEAQLHARVEAIEV
jgi:hypothetical protein